MAETITLRWNNGLRCRVNYSIDSQSTSANTTSLSINSVSMIADSSLGTYWVTGTVKVDGENIWRQSSTGNTQIVLYTAQYMPVFSTAKKSEIVHNNDGTKGVTISVSLNFTAKEGTHVVSYSGSATIDLPTIPRVSNISVSPVTLGEIMYIYIDRPSISFVDTVTWSIGQKSGVIAEKTSDGSLTWLTDISLATEEISKQYADVILSITSYDGDTQIGTRSVTVPCYIPDSVAPTISSLTHSDKNGLYQEYGTYVQGKSNIEFVVGYDTQYGATVSDNGIKVSIGGISKYGETTEFVPSGFGEVSVTVSVTDSRGKSSSGRYTISVHQYAEPSVELISVYRCNEDGDADRTGSFAKAVFSARCSSINDENYVEYNIVKSARDGSSIPIFHAVDMHDYIVESFVTDIFAVEQSKSYNCYMYVDDGITAKESLIITIPVSFALMDFNTSIKSIAFGQVASDDESVFDIGMPVRSWHDIDMKEHTVTGLIDPVQDGDAVNKRFLDNRISYVIGKDIVEIKGDPGEDYVLTQADKVEIADIVASMFGIAEGTGF